MKPAQEIVAVGPGTRLGNYRIVRPLGEGGMGAVWEAHHELLQKRVALKTLHAQVATSPEVVARFLREGQAASRIIHPHVVDVTDVGVDRDIPYLVMEFLEGETLASRIEREGALAPEIVADLFLPVIDALHAAHLAGVIHRDLKPDNIFLARTAGHVCHPVVLDFGISKLNDAEQVLTRTHAMMGTPYYMSPEQARGARDVDPRSDQFSFGLVLYEALGGRRAVEAASVLEAIHHIVTGHFLSLDLVRPGLPRALVGLVERCLELQPSRRFSSMGDVGGALLPFASSSAQPSWQARFPPSSEQSVSTAPTLLAAPTASSSTGGSHAPANDASRSVVVATEAFKPPKRFVIGGVALVGVGLVVAASWGWHGESDTAIGTDTRTVLNSTEIGAAADPGSDTVEASTGTPPAGDVDAARTLAIRVSAEPSSAVFVLDGRQVGTGTIAREMENDHVPHVLMIAAPGHVSHEIEFVDVAPVAHVVLEPVSPRRSAPPPRRSRMTAAGLETAPEPEPVLVEIDDTLLPTNESTAPVVGRRDSVRPVRRESVAAGEPTVAPVHNEQPQTGANGALIIR